MEMLLLLLVPLALGSLFLGGGSDDETDTPPEQETESNQVTGTAEDDLLRGTTAADAVDGAEGDDLLFGYGNADTLDGGDGSDFIDGGNGGDLLRGDAGDDLIVGGNGDDSISGGSDDDLLAGGAGDDTITGGNGDDALIGSTGADQLFGGLGDDVLDGVSPTGTDTLAQAFTDLRPELDSAFSSRYGDDATGEDLNRFMRDIASESGEDAPDTLDGGAGEDIMIGNDGDTLTGGDDEDTFFIDWASGNSAVSITDFNALGETVFVQIEQDSATVPDFGIRDAADGAGVEIVLDGSVVALLDDLSVAAMNASQIKLQVDLDGFITDYSATVLPSVAA